MPWCSAWTKPSIQALERARGYVQTSSGKIVQGMRSTYKRHGTVNLFAALEVATGIMRGKTTQTKKRADFQAFMEEVIADQPAGRQIHVILDNLNTHKRNDAWLATHPNVTLSLHTHQRQLAQSGGDLVRHLSAQDAEQRELPQH